MDAGALTVSNVKDWNAVGDGTTDDRQAIQDAINDTAADPEGGAVYFPPGTYRLVSGPTQAPLLKVPSRTKLIGHGPLSVLKADANGNGTVGSVLIQLSPAPTTDVHIEDLTLDCNSSVKVFGVQAASGGGAHERIVFRRVELKNHTRPSPDQASFAFTLVLRNSLIEGCHVHHTQRDGLDVFSSDGVVIRGNVIEDCGDDHIVATGSGTGVTVVGNVVRGNTTAQGCGIVAGNRVSVVGNVVFGAVHSGIEVKGGSTDVVISGNVVSEAGNSNGQAKPGANLGYGTPKGAGIGIFSGSNSAPNSASRILISDNVIVSPRSFGIVLIESKSTSSVSDVRIEGNTIWMEPLGSPLDPDLYNYDVGVPVRRNGIGVVGDFNDNPPIGNITDVRVSGNDVRLASHAGINPRGDKCARWDIRDNTVLESGTSSANQPGILLDGVSSAMVLGNRSQDLRGTAYQSYGIKILNPSGKYLVTDNDVTSNGSGGISPAGPSTGPILWTKDNLGDDLV